MLCKAISNIVLARIQPKVGKNTYLSHSQNAYRQDRSPSDILWYHRLLVPGLQKFQEEIMTTGIEITSAFDTIKRSKLIEILEPFLRER